MNLPSLRDWIFSLKTFLAAMLALYIAFYVDLPRPYWAMASVYIVSNPFVGATRFKGVYRVLGTVLGAAAAVALSSHRVIDGIRLHYQRCVASRGRKTWRRIVNGFLGPVFVSPFCTRTCCLVPERDAGNLPFH